MPSWRNSCRTEAAWPFATYLGGGGFDNATGIAVGADGTAYVTGSTQFDPDVSSTASPDFPLANPLQSRFGGVEDAFVTKFSRNGSSLVYSTYLGGELNDDGRAVAVDSAGAVYVTGVTHSSDFPIRNALQPTLSGYVDDVFVAPAVCPS